MGNVPIVYYFNSMLMIYGNRIAIDCILFNVPRWCPNW